METKNYHKNSYARNFLGKHKKSHARNIRKEPCDRRKEITAYARKLQGMAQSALSPKVHSHHQIWPRGHNRHYARNKHAHARYTQGTRKERQGQQILAPSLGLGPGSGPELQSQGPGSHARNYARDTQGTTQGTRDFFFY